MDTIVLQAPFARLIPMHGYSIPGKNDFAKADRI